VNLVADTHALIWYLFEPDQLSLDAHSAMAQAGAIYVSAISVVEIRYLVEKGSVLEAAFEMIIDYLTDPTTAPTLIPLGLEIAEAVEQIARKTVPDMPDRIIAATALHLNLPLITRDRKIQAAGITTIW
jgi:PIN domain nuclease of toxin-antitoxin system